MLGCLFTNARYYINYIEGYVYHQLSLKYFMEFVWEGGKKPPIASTVHKIIAFK